MVGRVELSGTTGCYSLPVRHRWGDVSVIETGVPGKQDDASVAKYTVEKQLRTKRKKNRSGILIATV